MRAIANHHWSKEPPETKHSTYVAGAVEEVEEADDIAMAELPHDL